MSTITPNPKKELSGGDVTLNGAQVRAKQVTGTIAGDLIITSPQDTASAKSRGERASLSATFGYGASVSAQASQSKVDADYAAANQHSGIHAGDGGYQITTGGATYLNGGVIVSTQEAIDQNKNILDTAAIVHTDVKNHSSHDAKASTYGMGGGASVTQGEDNTSVTQSGVSQGQLIVRDEQLQQSLTGQTTEEAKASVNRSLTTDNLPGKLEQHWNVQEIEQEVTAQATAIASVHKALAREAGDFAKAKEAEAKANGDVEGEKLWKEGGAAHVLLHTGLGLLTGNVAGAVGAAVASLAAPVLSEVQDGVTNILKDAGASDVVAKETGKIVASATAAAGGAIVSGSPGAAAALNTEMFNRQLHHNEKELIKKKSNGDKETEERLTKAACYAVQCWAQFPEGSTLYQQNYVGSAEAASLSQEIQWVQQQKSDGYFNYTTFDKVTDAIAATTGLSSVNGKGTFNGEYINKPNSPRLPNACATAECAAGLPPNSTPEQTSRNGNCFYRHIS